MADDSGLKRRKVMLKKEVVGIKWNVERQREVVGIKQILIMVLNVVIW